MSFHSIYRHGFARVAAGTIKAGIADPKANAEAILDAARAADESHAALLLLPELALSAYAIDDLLLQDALLEAVEAGVARVIEGSRDLFPLILFGAPLRHRGRLYNCAVAVHRGRLLGVVPKVHLPNYREFYERRHFASGDGAEGDSIALVRAGSALRPGFAFRCGGSAGLRRAC